MKPKRYWISVAAGIVLLATPASASGATQIGETFLPSAPNSNDTNLQSGSPAGQYTASFSGVITSWSFQAGADPPTLNFKVARSAGGNDFTIVGESGLKTGIVANTLHTFPARIPAQGGDVIGFFVGDPGEVSRTGATGYTVGDDDDDLDQSVGRTDLYAPTAGTQLDLSAILEPDCDADGFGDESQDPELTGPNCPSPPKSNRSVTLDANRNKVEKGKKVRLSGQLSAATGQGPCESSQTVELQRKKPSQASFATYEQLQTDAQGTFSLKQKVKKTFEYRAQVVETAACTAAQSNSERVKVKKKR